MKSESTVIQFAVFNGEKEITDKIYAEVKNFVNFISQQNTEKKK